MKLPERLVGFVNYGDTKYPFEFDKESFYLNLYPPTTEIWDETSSFREFFRSFEKNEKKHEWIGELRIEGFSSDGKKVIFCLQNHRSNYHGFYSYPVNWYFYYSEQMKSDELDGFSVECEEINYFFNPQQAIESILHFSSDRSKLEKITVQSNKQITEQCGKYRIIPHVDAQIEVTCYAVAHSNSYTNPIDATSKMVVSFSSPVSIDTVIDAYRHTTCFLQFITYRKNIVFNTVPVFIMNANGLREYAGLLVFGKEPEAETHKNRKEVIIPYHVLQMRTAKIFTNIKNNKLVFQHLCESIEDTLHYPSSRIIMIFAAFEREYRNIYGVDSDRSQEYIDTKSEVVDLINNYTRSLHGDKRKYAKQLSKYVNNRDSSFEFNLKKALKDCEDVMLPFVRIKYSGDYADAVDGICERMGAVRNGIAHSRLDLHFDAIHLSDIKIVEELLYAMRLRHCHVKIDAIRKSINGIFRENIAL